MSDYRKVRGGAAATGGTSTPAFTAMTTSDPDVKGLWNFEETSGTTFADEVAATNLTAVGSTSIGTYFNYNIDADINGQLANIAPALMLQQMALENTALPASFQPGTGSFTMEMYARFTSDSSNSYIMTTENAASAFSSFVYFSRSGTIVGRVYATDGSSVTISTAAIHNLCNGDVRHFRIVYDSSDDTLAMFLDGVSIASVSAAALSGKTVEINELKLSRQASASYSPTYYYQCRISHNATNNGYGLV